MTIFRLKQVGSDSRSKGGGVIRWDYDRAELIATTVAGDAYEAATAAAGRQLADAGLVMEKSWLTVGDDRVDVECEDNEAQGWIPMDDGFRSGHTRPPAQPACRCTALYRRRPG